MTEPMTSEREAFEKWVSEQSWFKATLGLMRTHDAYTDPCINSRWQGWQARAHLDQPAQAADVGFDEALNDAAWAFIEACPEKSALLFNNCKVPLKAAIEKWLSTRALTGEKAGRVDGWISVEDRLPERNKPAIYWHKSEFGGFAAIADEWRDEHHLAYATHWMPYAAPDKEGGES